MPLRSRRPSACCRRISPAGPLIGPMCDSDEAGPSCTPPRSSRRGTAMILQPVVREGLRSRYSNTVRRRLPRPGHPHIQRAGRPDVSSRPGAHGRPIHAVSRSLAFTARCLWLDGLRCLHRTARQKEENHWYSSTRCAPWIIGSHSRTWRINRGTSTVMAEVRARRACCVHVRATL